MASEPELEVTEEMINQALVLVDNTKIKIATWLKRRSGSFAEPIFFDSVTYKKGIHVYFKDAQRGALYCDFGGFSIIVGLCKIEVMLIENIEGKLNHKYPPRIFVTILDLYVYIESKCADWKDCIPPQSGPTEAASYAPKKKESQGDRKKRLAAAVKGSD